MIAPDGVAAVRQERLQMLRFCEELDAHEWQAASRAEGWRVQDVVAHIGSGCHAMFTPAVLKLLRSGDIENTNDTFVDQRAEWAPERVLSEYSRWSGRVVAAAAAVCRTPLAQLPMSLAELGRFPLGLLLCGAMTFDHHIHLRHDLAPATGRPVPGTDANRLAVVLQWMFAVLSNQLRRSSPQWLTDPIGISLHGPGGGTWLVRPDGSVVTATPGGALTWIDAQALEFPEWATKRAGWRDRDVTIIGDPGYGELFLDAVNVV